MNICLLVAPGFIRWCTICRATPARSVFTMALFWYRLLFKCERLHKLSRLAAFKENALINFLRLWNATSWPEFCGCWQTEFILLNPLSSSTLILFCFRSPTLHFSPFTFLCGCLLFFLLHLCLKTAYPLTDWWVQTFEPQSSFYNRSAGGAAW